MRNNKLQKWQRKWQKSRTLLAALVSLLMVFSIHIALTLAQETVLPDQQTIGNNLTALTPAEATWREAAAKNINTYRKGDLTVIVTDANGTPVPNVDIHVAMKRHAYSFGSAIDEKILLSNPSNSDSKKYRDSTVQLFNEAVIEDGLKWLNWENLESRPLAIDAVGWLRHKNLKVRGHNLVWPSWQNSPLSLKTLYDNTFDQEGEVAAAQVLRDQIIAHIREEVGYFKGQITDWDVVNEPSDNNDFQKVLGQSVLVDWFNAAHEADPDAVLYINENLFETSTQVDLYESEIQYLLDNGTPLGGIGLECHVFNGPPSIPEFLNTLDRLAKFHLPIKISEFDMLTPDKQLQADVTRDFMTAVFSNPATKGFLMWGFWDGKHWFEDAPIYYKDWSLKPSGKVYMDLVFNEWRTDVVGKTDTHGEYKVRGFLGDYEVTASKDLMSKTVSTTLSRDGTSLMISDLTS